MEKIFLINPPGDVIRTGRWVRKTRARQNWFPIFLGYATGTLEKSGYECKLVDASASQMSFEDTDKLIESYKPHDIVYYWAYDTATDDLVYAEKLGQKYNVILVGPWSATIPNALDNYPHIDAMTFGAFEFNLLDYIQGKDKSLIPGLKYRDGNEILYNPQGEPFGRDKLDWMPFVTDVYKRHLNLRNYHQTSFKFPFVDLFTARSCPYRCKYCQWIWGMDQLHPHRYQQRSLKNVMDELWYIHNEIPEVKQIFFQDSTLIKPRAVEISHAILDQGLKITWGCYSRADRNYDDLKLMKDAGLRTLHVGYEVPVQSVLDEIGKDITVEQMTIFAKAVKDLDLWTSSAFMIFPWETKEQVEFTVNWIKKSGAKRINLVQLQPYPNTPIIDMINAYKDLPNKHVMNQAEMKCYEQWGLKEFHLKNPTFWWEVIKHPSEWRNVIHDGIGLLKFLGD